MPEPRNFTHEAVTKQERCSTETNAQGDSSIFAGWPRTNCQNSSNPSNLGEWLLLYVSFMC